MNNANLNDLSLVISSCNAYSDLWDAHISLLNRYWPDCPNGTYIVTDEQTDKSFYGVTILCTGANKEMPDRLKEAMSSIETEYILLTLDDYFLIRRVNNEAISRILNFMKENRIDYVRLYDIPNERKRVQGEKGLYWIDTSESYGVNLYAGIWKKSFLEKTFRESQNAWNYEVSLDSVARKENARCVLSKRHEYVILDVIRKGKVLHKANRYLKRHGYDIGERPLQTHRVEAKLFVIGRGKRILPKPLHKYVKSVMRKFGYSFFSDQAPKE